MDPSMHPEARAAKPEGGLAARLLCLLIMTGQGIWINKIQLFLTLLTMAVGSFALSLTFFLGDGARIYLWQDMEQLMGSWVIASPATHYDSYILKTRINADFTPEDLQFVKEQSKSARFIEPFYQGSVPVSYRNVSRVMAIDGVTIDLSREPLFVPTKGHGFSEAGYKILVWECLLTESAVKALGIEIADNPTILIDGRPFHVLGVTPDPPGADDIFRPRITVPYSCARALWLPSDSIGEILVAWRGLDTMDEVTGELRAALEMCRGVDTYFLSSSQFKIQKSRSIVANFMMYGQVQAFFCIAIAFVGVMNVMLTNTARRSNEFAVRLSMGARHYQLLAMVLLESSLLGVVGALIGVALSASMAPFAGRLLQSKINGVSALLPYYGLKGVIYPVLVCGLAGLIAGVMPALNVRRLDVLASLRNNN
jgi:putative ABC transport system permease protein